MELHYGTTPQGAVAILNGHNFQFFVHGSENDNTWKQLQFF